MKVFKSSIPEAVDKLHINGYSSGKGYGIYMKAGVAGAQSAICFVNSAGGVWAS